MLKYEYVCGSTCVRSSFLVGSGSGILGLLQKPCIVWPRMGNVNHDTLQDVYHDILLGCEVRARDEIGDVRAEIAWLRWANTNLS